MHNFDRGLIKWLPFDALSGYKEAIRELKNKRNKFEKPSLSEDQLNELNYELSTATNLKKSITVYYYSKGNIYYKNGFVTDIDCIHKEAIRLNKTWLKTTNILKIEIN